jgi:hypothetical protein
MEKPTSIQFILNDEDLPDIYEAPKPAKSQFPDWYKDASPTINREEVKILPNGKRNGTYKKCMPFMDAMASGYIVTLPCDVLVVKDPMGNQAFQWTVDGNVVATHSKSEHPGFPIPDGYNQTVFTWLGHHIIKTPKGTSCLFTHPLNRNDLPFRVVSGVVDTDAYLAPVDSPFLIEKSFTGILPQGTPICQIIPFRRESWVSAVAHLTKKELNNWMNRYMSKLVSAYRASVWSKKEYN